MDVPSLSNIQWGPVLEGFGTGMDFFGKMNQADALSQYGDAAKSAAGATADQLRVNAGQAVASSQYQMLELRRQGEVQMSRAKALLSASGGGSDPTTVAILARLQGAQDQAVANAGYKGRSEEQALRSRADMTDYQGSLEKWSADKQASASEASAWGGLFKNAIGMWDKYGKHDAPSGGNASPGITSIGKNDISTDTFKMPDAWAGIGG